jgi:polysaccharide export outer membrane protein
MVGCSGKYRLFEDKDRVTMMGEKSDEGLIEKLFPKKKENILKDSSTHVEEKPIDFKYSSKIIAGDELQIDIFNKSKIARFEDIHSIDPSDITLKQTKANNNYIVEDDGTIYLPLLGEISVSSMSQSELGEYLTQKYKRYFNKPHVKVKLKSTRIYVLGEISKPGVLPVPPSGVSIFEVIAKSGDFTDYAQKDEIRVISGKLGKQTIRIINLTSMKSINNTDLMIKPNSIVYIAPRSMKEVKVSVADISPIISLISSTLGAYLSIDYISNGRD